MKKFEKYLETRIYNENYEFTSVPDIIVVLAKIKLQARD